MNRRLLFFLGCFFAFGPFSGLWAEPAGTPRPLSFREVLHIASEKNPEVLMADERVRQAAERFHQARSYFFPHASVDSSWTRKTENLESFGIPVPPSSPSPLVGPFNVFDARVRATQTLFDLGMIRRLELARLGRELSAEESAKTREDALALAGTLFVEAKRSQDAVELSKTLLRLAGKKRRLAEENRRLGTDSDLAAARSKAEWLRSRAEYRKAVTQRDAKFLDLKAALGFSPVEPLELVDRDFPARPALPRSGRLENASKHPEVALAEKNTELLRAEKNAEEADFFPRVTGSADYGANGKTPGDSEETYSYGIQASWPVFEAGGRQAKIEEAQSKLRESRVRLADTRRGQENAALEARDSFKDARLMLAATEEQLSFWTQQLGSVRDQFNNGSASHLEFMEAAAQKAQAADEREEAVALYRAAQIRLAHALGEMKTLL